MFKVNNKDTRTTSTTDFTYCSSVSIADFEQVNASWVNKKIQNNAVHNSATNINDCLNKQITATIQKFFYDETVSQKRTT